MLLRVYAAIALLMVGSSQGARIATDASSKQAVAHEVGQQAQGRVRMMAKDMIEVASFIDWDMTTKIPPWLSPVKEGAAQGLAVLLGQSLKPDGSAPQVLIDRAKMAKKLLDQGKVKKIVLSGSDPAGVGTTEAYQAAQVLIKEGVPANAIIQDAQATTTAENAWFALRWIPRGTGQLYIITSDFHMARATYIFQETFNYFYKMIEDNYREDPEWKSETKKYPRLAIHQVPTESFCGSDGSLNRDDDPAADINTKSLALRASNELGFLGGGEVGEAMYGEPLNKVMYIWPVQIDVTQDPENEANFQNAMAQQMNVAQALCACKSPPEQGGPEYYYPLTLPASTEFPGDLTINDWEQIGQTCPLEGTLQLKSSEETR